MVETETSPSLLKAEVMQRMAYLQMVRRSKREDGDKSKIVFKQGLHYSRGELADRIKACKHALRVVDETWF